MKTYLLYAVIYTVFISLLASVSGAADKPDLNSLVTQLKSGNVKARTEAAELLGTKKYQEDKTVITLLLNVVQGDEDFQVRRYAANSLVKNKADPRVIPGLIIILESKGSRGSREAAEALGQTSDKSAIPSLITALKHKNENVRKAAVESLGQFINTDQQVAPALTETLSNDDFFLARKYAAEGLVKGDKKKLVPTMITALTDPKSKGHREAAETLGKIKDKRAIQPLIAASKDKDEDVRKSVADSLGTYISDDPKVFDTLVDMAMNDSFFLARRNAVTQLMSKRPIEASNKFILAMEQENVTGNREMAEALGKSKNPRAVPALIKILSLPDSEAQRAAAESLGSFSGDQIAPELNKLAGNPKADPYAKKAAIQSILKFKDPSSIPVLISALNDRYSTVRQDAAAALAEFGDSSALEGLVGLLGDSEDIVRVQAAYAIRKILNRLPASKSSLKHFSECLPKIVDTTYDKSTVRAAQYLDIFLWAGLPVFSGPAAGGKQTVQKLPPDIVLALQKMIKEMV